MNHTLADPFISHDPQPQPQPVNMNRPNPPPFQLQQSFQGFGTMNNLDTLRVRSIELETELRLTKEQLLQAQSGTQYLVNCFATQRHRDLVQGVGQNQFTLEDRNQQLETEVHRLRGQLLVQSREKSTYASLENNGWGYNSGGWVRTRAQELEEEVSELKSQRASLLNDVLRLLKEDANEYSFDFDDEDPGRYHPLEHFKHKVAALEKDETSLLDGDLLGETHDFGSPFEEKAAARKDSPFQSATPAIKRHSIYIKPGDIALLDFDTAEKARYEPRPTHSAANSAGSRRSTHHRATAGSPGPDFGLPSARRPLTPPYERRDRRHSCGFQRFAPFEHNHLMANATFIEEKEGEDYLEFWESLAGRFSRRHTKEEWKSYYETTVRPMYLQKMAQRKAPVVAAVKENAAPVKETEFAAEATEVVGKTVAAHHQPANEHTSAQVKAAVVDPSDVGGVERQQVSRPKSLGLKASQWATRKQEDVTAVSARHEAATEKAAHEVTVAPKSQPVVQQEAPTTPEIPAFGSLDPLPKPAPSELSGPIPGLAGGWPQPIPRGRSRAARRSVAPSTSENDPGTWNHLFFAIERKTERLFILGRNEKLFRTVTISGVPVRTTLAEVLDKVRGGKIVSARFFDTAGMKTKPPMTTNTVIVEFLGSQGAKAFAEHCDKHPMRLVDGKEEGQVGVNVELVPTQTMPLPQALHADLVRPEGALTRVLFLIFGDAEKAPTPDVLAPEIMAFAVRCNYCDLPKKPLRITSAEDGMLLFEYADVRQAAAAWNAVAALEWKLGEVSKGFAADPCGRAFEEVEGERKENEADTGGEGEKAAEVALDELEAEAKSKLMEG